MIGLPQFAADALAQHSTARLCARYAQAAYGHYSSIEGDVTPIEVGADTGYVLRDQDGIALIAIAGTNNLMQWWGNLQQDWKGVAARFSIQTDRILETMLAEWGKDIKLIFTGHSRGGPIAQHLARLYEHWNPTCITFGTPRGCKDNIELPNAVSYCLPWDPVPMIPIHSRGYRDPATRKYLLPTGIDDEDPWSLGRAIWSATSIAAIYAWEWRQFRWGSDNVVEWALKRHAMELYAEALQ